MKTVMKLALAIALSTTAGTAALAIDYTKGKVEKVDAKAKKVTLEHEELKNLGMPAMTMVFRVSDDAMLAKLKEGANVEFVADRVDGKLTVTAVK